MLAGYPGFAKYTNFGRPWTTWELNQKEEGRRVALANRTVTWVNFPLTQEQAGARILSIRLLSPGAQGLRVLVNKTRLDTAKISSGWQTVSLSIPPGAIRSGENRLELSWGNTGRIGKKNASAAVEWIAIGPKTLSDATSLEVLIDGKLNLPKAGGVAFYVSPYKGAKLKLRYKDVGEGRCQVTVRLYYRGGLKPIETNVTQMAKKIEGELLSVVNLDPVAEKVGRLELMAGGDNCKAVGLSEAAIVMPEAAPKVARGKAPRNVLFWMIDNVRADRYSLYNPKTRVKTPIIEELGKTGTVFERAYIQGNESRVSHACIWTGMYPKQHKFIDPKAKLSSEWVTMPEAVRKGDLYTAAWIANGFVSKFWGFGKGWDFFRNNLHEGGGLTGEALADMAIKFIEERGEKRFFGYVGTIDPHVSWKARQPWLKEYHPEPYDGPFKKNVPGKDVEKMATGKRETSLADRKRVIAIYDSTVSYNDQQLGRVLKALKDRGVRDETMVIITADHGEEFWEYGRIGHGHSAHQELVGVPLIIHYPPLFGRGVRVREGVNVLSLMPSILDAIGVPIPSTVQGESLLILAQGEGRGYPRPAMSTQYEFAHTILLERWKLWVGGKGEPQLYDIDSKEGERREIGADHPLELRWLTDSLSTFLSYQTQWRELRWGVPSNQKSQMPEDLETGGGLGPIKKGS
jgi:choline-sulfatase